MRVAMAVIEPPRKCIGRWLYHGSEVKARDTAAKVHGSAMALPCKDRQYTSVLLLFLAPNG